MTVLNCLVCDKMLDDAGYGMCENQPYGGTTFLSHGQYGSTVFDPMDGHYIEINICDQCLVKAGKRQQVLTSRDSIPVLAPDHTYGYTNVGHKPVDRPLVYWREDLPGYGDDDVYKLTFDDDESVPENIRLNIPYDQLKLDYEVQEIMREIDGGREVTQRDRDLVRSYLNIPGKWDRSGFLDKFHNECLDWLSENKDGS